MINKKTAFNLANGFARQSSSDEVLRAKLRHAADILSHLDQASVDRFVAVHFPEFVDQHSTWLESYSEKLSGT